MIVTNVGRVAVDVEVPITNGTEAYGVHFYPHCA